MRIPLIVYTFALLSIGLPIAAQTDITWDVDEGCAPLRVRFAVDISTSSAIPADTATWDFGNGQTVSASVEDTVETIFTEYRTAYTISLSITGSVSETITKFYNGVRGPLISNFSIEKNRDEPDYTYTFTPTIDSLKVASNYTFAWEHRLYSDSSLLSNTTYLSVTDLNEVIEQYTYADTGIYLVSLRIQEVNPTYTCRSITDTILTVRNEFIVGNVFTPETTDYFIIDPKNSEVVLSFKLFSRTGIKIFEQEAPLIYWGGTNDSGQKLGNGVYFYVVEATQGDTSGFYTKKGFIHLFR
jgi:hypothetical protein